MALRIDVAQHERHRQLAELLSREARRKLLALLHGRRSDEEGLAEGMPPEYLYAHRTELSLACAVDLVRQVLALPEERASLSWPMVGLESLPILHIRLLLQLAAEHASLKIGGQFLRLEVVNLVELLRLGHRGAGHACQLCVPAEVVLQGDGRDSCILLLDLHLLLRLDSLMDAIGPAPSWHEASGVRVHNEHLAIVDHIVAVLQEERPGAQGLLEVPAEVRLLGTDLLRSKRVAEPHAEQPLGRPLSRLGERNGLVLLVDLIVHRRELSHHVRHCPEHLIVLLPRAGDDEGGTRLVDEDAVHLVHDGVMMIALGLVLELPDHVVAQVIEAELAARAVGDIGVVGLLPGHGPQPVRQLYLRTVPPVEQRVAVPDGRSVLENADGHPERLENRAHPARVSPGEIVVDRDEMGALSREGVEIERQSRHEGLSLSRAHLQGGAFMQKHPSRELHIVMPQPDGALRGLAHRGKGLRENVVQYLSCGEPLAVFCGLVAKLPVTQCGHLALKSVDAFDYRRMLAIRVVPEESVQHPDP